MHAGGAVGRKLEAKPSGPGVRAVDRGLDPDRICDRSGEQCGGHHRNRHDGHWPPASKKANKKGEERVGTRRNACHRMAYYCRIDQQAPLDKNKTINYVDMLTRLADSNFV